MLTKARFILLAFLETPRFGVLSDHAYLLNNLYSDLMKLVNPLFLMLAFHGVNARAEADLFVNQVDLPTGGTEIVVENRNFGSVSAVMWVDAENTYSNTSLPTRFVIKTSEKRVAFVLSPQDRTKPSRFKVYVSTMFGDAYAEHNPRAKYRFPFSDGITTRVTQSFGDMGSHKAMKTPHAVDFAMPIGTPVVAAREGVVVAVKNDSSVGGNDISFTNKGNYVYIQHDDGTVAKYLHLAKGNSPVYTGMKVSAGEKIGYSGNTGFSSSPHLHFEIFKPIYTASSILEGESLPVHFTSGLSVFRAKTGNIVSSEIAKTKNNF